MYVLNLIKWYKIPFHSSCIPSPRSVSNGVPPTSQIYPALYLLKSHRCEVIHCQPDHIASLTDALNIFSSSIFCELTHPFPFFPSWNCSLYYLLFLTWRVILYVTFIFTLEFLSHTQLFWGLHSPMNLGVTSGSAKETRW